MNNPDLEEVIKQAKRIPLTQTQWANWAADCAERVLHIFEAKHPGDNRPRLAIEAARAGDPDAAHAAFVAAHTAAYVASAAASAASAAARAAARAAAHAASAAFVAASAASAARAAAHAAAHAAFVAARAARAAFVAASAVSAASPSEELWQAIRLLGYMTEEIQR